MTRISKVQTPDTNSASGGIFISPKDAAAELGQLFIVTRFRLPDQTEVIDDLHDHIHRIYYTSAEESAAAALEEVAARLNDELTDFFPSNQIEDGPRLVDILMGVLEIHEDSSAELHFTKTGAVHLLLRHGQTLMDVTAEATASEDVPEGDDDSLFSAITSGPLTAQDTIFAASASLLDYFSEEKLKQILDSGNSEAIMADISDLVDEFSSKTMFQALVIKLAESHATEPSTENKVAKRKERAQEVKASMSELNEISAKTSEIMSASLLKSVCRSLGSLLSDLKSLGLRSRGRDEVASRPSRLSRPGRSGGEELAIRRRKQARSGTRRLGANLLLLVKVIGLVIFWILKQFYVGLVFIVRNRGSLIPKTKQALSGLPSKTKALVKGKRTQVSHMPPRRRWLLLIGSALAIILIVSLISGLISSGGGRNREAFAMTAAQIEDKKSAADAALIYGDESQAVEMIAEARVLLEQLPEKPNDLKERKAQLASDIFKTYTKLQRLEEITSPVLIANLGTPDSGPPINMETLAGSGSVFYGLTDENTIFKFDISQSEVGPFAATTDTITDIFTASQDQVFTYQNLPEAKLQQIDLASESFQDIDITFNDVVTDKAAIVSYFSRLYVLDPRNRQIYKHQRVGNAYTRGEPWLNDDSVDLSSATDLAIDGAIWVVTKAGDLYKLNKGIAEELGLERLDPGLNSPNFIWTSVDSDKVYLLDPPTRRVIILNKDGSISKQYVSEHFDDLRAAAVDEANGKIYVLNGSVLFEINITE